jgi:hypothetical protein
MTTSTQKENNVKATAEVKAIVTLSDERVIEAQFLAEGVAPVYTEEHDSYDFGSAVYVDAEVQDIQPMFPDEYLEDGIQNDNNIEIVQVIKVLDNVTEWSFDI